MLVVTQGLKEKYQYEKVWNAKKSNKSKNENWKRSRANLFQGPRWVWHFPTRRIIAWAPETRQLPVVEMLSILMLSALNPHYLLCVFSQWIIAVFLQTVYSTTVESLNIVKGAHVKGTQQMVTFAW